MKGYRQLCQLLRRFCPDSIVRSRWSPIILLTMLAGCPSRSLGSLDETTPAAGAPAPAEPAGPAEPAAAPPELTAGDPLVMPLFSWPPPAASTAQVLAQELLEQGRPFQTLSDANEALRSALESRGYERSYWPIPNGFAIVTKLERIDKGGRYSAVGRYAYGPSTMEEPSFLDYVRLLLWGDRGYYRQIVFAVTDIPFAQVTTKISPEVTNDWWSLGLNDLPHEIAVLPWTPRVRCTALIYEFEWPPNGPRLVRPSRLRANVHLHRSGLLDALASTKGASHGP